LKVHADVRWDYPPYEAIVRYALRHKPDLLIMPTRRAQLTEQRLLSYADHRLIETCPYPLLLLKKREVYSNGTVVAAVDPGHVHAGVAELDERILGAANAVALALGGASVHLCHLLMPEYQLEQEPGGGATRPLGTGRAAEVARLVAMRERLCHLAARHAIPSARVHVRFGRIRDALPALARELRAEIVVMGAVSRSVIGRAIYTQTAEHLLEALGCDVLVVKPSNFRCPISQRAPGLAPLAVTPHGAQRRAAG
jgi:universal stress protein E